MQIFCPHAVHFISLTIDLWRLLIISSNHTPLCSVHTMMRPLASAVVSLQNCSFHTARITAPVWPSSDWLMPRVVELLSDEATSRSSFSICFSQHRLESQTQSTTKSKGVFLVFFFLKEKRRENQHQASAHSRVSPSSTSLEKTKDFR